MKKYAGIIFLVAVVTGLIAWNFKKRQDDKNA